MREGCLLSNCRQPGLPRSFIGKILLAPSLGIVKCPCLALQSLRLFPKVSCYTNSHDLLYLENAMDDAKGNTREPELEGSLCNSLGSLRAQADELNRMGLESVPVRIVTLLGNSARRSYPNEHVIREVAKVSNLSRNGRQSLDKWSGREGSTKRSLQVFHRLSEAHD